MTVMKFTIASALFMAITCGSSINALANSICEGNLGATDVTSKYTTEVAPSSRLETVIETNAGIQILSMSRDVDSTSQRVDHKIYQIVIRAPNGHALRIFEPSKFEHLANVIGNYAVSADEKMIALLTDYPHSRSSHGYSSHARIRIVHLDGKTQDVNVNRTSSKGKRSELNIDMGRIEKNTPQAKSEQFPMTFSADGTTLYASDKMGIYVIDSNTGLLRETITRAELGYTSAMDKMKRPLDPEDYQHYEKIYADEKITSVSFNTSADRVAITFKDRGPVLWSLRDKKVIGMPGKSLSDKRTSDTGFTMVSEDLIYGRVRADKKDPESKAQWMVLSTDNEVVWKGYTEEPAKSHVLQSVTGRSKAVFLVEQKGEKEQPKIWLQVDDFANRSSYEVEIPAEFKRGLHSITLSPDENFLAALPLYTYRDAAPIFDLKSGKVVWKFSKNDDGVLGIVFNPYSQVVFVDYAKAGMQRVELPVISGE